MTRAPKPFSNEYKGGIARELATALAEIELLRADRDKYQRAWNEVTGRYEALLNQLGAADA